MSGRYKDKPARLYLGEDDSWYGFKKYAKVCDESIKSGIDTYNFLNGTDYLLEEINI